MSCYRTEPHQLRKNKTRARSHAHARTRGPRLAAHPGCQVVAFRLVPATLSSAPRSSLLESRLEDHFQAGVRSLGGMAIKQPATRVGVPDRTVLLPGGLVKFVELKKSGEKPSAIQLEIHRRMRALGADVVVLTGLSEILAWLNDQREALRTLGLI